MPSAIEPSPQSRVVRPPIGWFRWWSGASLLLALLGFLAYCAFFRTVPYRILGLMLSGWLIPCVILVSHLRPRPNQQGFERP